MPFTYRTDYQNMQPQEIDPRFQHEKKTSKKGTLLAIVFAFIFIAVLTAAALILKTVL